MKQPSLKAVREAVIELNKALGITVTKNGTGRKAQRPRNVLRHKFLKHMAANPNRRWKTHEFKRFARQSGLASTTLFNMMKAGQVRRTGEAEYQLTAMGKQRAKGL